jgi:hypothetical protein
MDSNRKFNRADIPYYQEWIRKVSGRKRISVLPTSIDDMVALFPFCRVYGDGETDEEAKKRHLDYFKFGIGWADTIGKNILLNVERIERLQHGKACYVKAILLHEAGHIINPRDKHGKSGCEFIAELYALKKACRLGLEAELKEIRLNSSRWYLDSIGVNSKMYKIAFRMLKGVGVY